MKVLLRLPLLFLFLAVFPGILQAQTDSLTAIAYRNSGDFKKNNPMFTSSFEYTLRYTDLPYDSYSVKPVTVKLKKKEAEYGIWLIDDGDHYYLNAVRHGFRKGYIKLSKQKGRYYHFIAKPGVTISQEQKLQNASFQFGLIGTAIAASQIANENEENMNQVWDVQEGRVFKLTSSTMQTMLSTHADLLEQFNAHPENGTIAVCLQFLDLLNGS